MLHNNLIFAIFFIVELSVPFCFKAHKLFTLYVRLCSRISIPNRPFMTSLLDNISNEFHDSAVMAQFQE